MVAVFRVCMFVCAGASHSLDAVNRLNGDAAPIWVQGHLEDAETVGAGTISLKRSLPSRCRILSLNAEMLLTLPRQARANIILNATESNVLYTHVVYGTVRTLQSVTMEDGSTRFETHHVFPQTSLTSVPSLSWQTIEQ
jgi:hypothetical protein